MGYKIEENEIKIESNYEIIAGESDAVNDVVSEAEGEAEAEVTQDNLVSDEQVEQESESEQLDKVETDEAKEGEVIAADSMSDVKVMTGEDIEEIIRSIENAEDKVIEEIKEGEKIKEIVISSQTVGKRVRDIFVYFNDCWPLQTVRRVVEDIEEGGE